MYIDTEGCFRPQRIKDIAVRYQVDGDQVLENVVFARAHNSEEQVDLLKQAAALMSEVRPAASPEPYFAAPPSLTSALIRPCSLL